MTIPQGTWVDQLFNANVGKAILNIPQINIDRLNTTIPEWVVSYCFTIVNLGFVIPTYGLQACFNRTCEAVPASEMCGATFAVDVYFNNDQGNIYHKPTTIKMLSNIIKSISRLSSVDTYIEFNLDLGLFFMTTFC